MKMGKRSFANYLASSVCTSALLLTHASHAETAPSINFNITASDLSDALNQFAQQSDRQIIYASNVTAGHQAKPLHGVYSTHDALESLLSGSGLAYRVSKDETIVVVADAKAAPRSIGAPPQNPIRLAAAAQTSPAAASSNNASAAPVEEVVVTGSRIIREGYEAPTPLTVVGVEQLQNSASSSLMTYLNDIPALSGSSLNNGTTGSVTQGGAGSSTVNLKSLGPARTLVLLDGQRMVGYSYTGFPNIGMVPQQLIERVDIVTGGVSAVYGSDAVAGVVNFVLNKKFTGVKADISGGVTNYGDGKNYKIDLSAGFAFGPDDRGHVLLSGEHLFDEGIFSTGGRKWAEEGGWQITNPAYNATTNSSVPQLLFLPHVGLAGGLPGGIISAGPLKGTAFGPGGVPFKYNYGSIYSNPYGYGGDWELNDRHRNADLSPKQNSQNVFTQISYDITDNITAHFQYIYTQFHSSNNLNRYYNPGSATSPLIKIDNAYLPTSVRAAMVATNITTFQLGTDIGDIGYLRAQVDLIGNRVNPGLEGSFDMGGSTWRWKLDYLYNSTKQNAHAFAGFTEQDTTGAVVNSLFLQSVDAVLNPATGQIVCRIALTNPATTCKPWNAMGIGVNDPRTASFLRPNYQHNLHEKTVYSASITGEPFSSWAGPVGLAFSFEHRKDSLRSLIDPESVIFDRIQGTFGSVNGSSSVTEGAVEALVPLAKGESWAQNWDLSLAARFTGYELSGYVTTWKIGSTYTPIEDIKFRFTRSRDIRAPSLQELFTTPGNSSGPSIIDRERGGVSYPTRVSLGSNPALQPEKADSTGVGVVFTPTFFEGFTASVDYWEVDLAGAIQRLGTQRVEDACFNKTNTAACAFITRDATTGLITFIQDNPINLAYQDMQGLDIEATYRRPMSAFVEDWGGNFSIHGLMTFYLKNLQDNTFSPVADRVGEITGGDGANPPYWKANVTATYTLDPVSISLTGRAVSANRVNSEYVECASGCPVSTVDHQTINNNHIPGRFYLDANFIYKLGISDTADTEMYFSVKNLFNNDPPLVPGTSPFSHSLATIALFDSTGTVYRLGVRLKM